jgi:hypothetical protein
MLQWPTHLTSVSEGTMALGQGEHRDRLAWEESERENYIEPERSYRLVRRSPCGFRTFRPSDFSGSKCPERLAAAVLVSSW